MSRPTRIAILLTLAVLALTSGITTLSAGSPAVEAAAFTVSGRVFHDLDMDGGYDEGEPAVDGASVQLSSPNDPNNPWTQTTVDVDEPFDCDGDINTPPGDCDGDGVIEKAGVFTFTGVAPGSYTLSYTYGVPYYGTTANNPTSFTVATAGVSVDFGLVLKLTIGGRVYTDTNANGQWDSGEQLVGATVMIIDDLNSSGRMDAGEPILNSDVTDDDGVFIVPNIVPGDRILAVRPAEIGGVWGDPAPLPLLASTVGGVELGDTPYVASTSAGDLADLTGTVWNDVDGDEIVDVGEPRLAGVELEVYVDGQTPDGSPLLAKRISDPDGKYEVTGVYADWPYEVRPVATTVPAGWLMSTDSALLFVAPTAAGPNVVNIGYYDPLSYAPLRQSDWKKELKQAGKPRYKEAQIDGFIAAIESEELSGIESKEPSVVFDEVVGVRAVLLQSPVHGDQGQALKEYAALRLNLASERLFAATAVNLPDLTTAKSIGAVVDEIEGILAPGRLPAPTKDDLQRVRRLAEAVNSGKGLGSGLTGVFGLASGTYRGASVVSKLRPGGDLVDLGTDAPAYLTKWIPGTLNSATNVFAPQLRVKVKVFVDGGVLEVVRVSDGKILGTIVPPVWNKDINATYTLDLQLGVSTVTQLTTGTEIQLFTRDSTAGGKAARVRIDSAELVFKY